MDNKYRKKPVVVEAFQMTQDRRHSNVVWPSWLYQAWNKDRTEAGALFPNDMSLMGDGSDDRLCVHTLEGCHQVNHGDYIIQGVKGELYSCKPDIFEATYEKVR